MNPIEIKISDLFKQKVPQFRVIHIEAEITNSPTSDLLWSEIEKELAELGKKYELSEVNKQNEIAATRKAYKTLGKEPNRYRPSAEALTRRAVKGIGLYRTLSAIDVINLISMKTGCSIGGFDKDKIQGTTLTLGVGEHEEPFEAIGRGPLNIEFLPVYRDSMGGIGTPTSDNERTKISPSTTNLLMTVNIYSSESDVKLIEDDVISLIKNYLCAKNITSELIVVSPL